MFDVAEETFLRVCDQIVDAMNLHIHQIVRWPTEAELPLYTTEFDKMGRYA